MGKANLVLHVSHEVRDQIIKFAENHSDSEIGKLINDKYYLIEDNGKDILINITDIEWDGWKNGFENELKYYMFNCERGEMFIINNDDFEIYKYGKYVESDIKFKLKMFIVME
jgi:hypothetical protein